MTMGDASRGTAVLLAQSRREPLWAIGLSILLVTAGLVRHPADRRSGERDRAEFDDGRGRFARRLRDPGMGMEGHSSARV